MNKIEKVQENKDLESIRNIFIDYFKNVWGIQFSQCKNRSVYRLRCGTKEARKFADIVKPYVIANPELHYKLNIKDYSI